MPVIHIPRACAPTQVEIPATVGQGSEKRQTKRSCKGSIHLRPGIKVVTKDELAVIAESLPKVYRRLRVIEGGEKRVAKPKVEAPVTPSVPDLVIPNEDTPLTPPSKPRRKKSEDR